MQKPLKKQIFQVKVSNFIKTHSVILFFAIFDLTQKQRGELKNQINLILNKSVPEHGKDFKLKASVCSNGKENQEVKDLEKYAPKVPCFSFMDDDPMHAHSKNGNTQSKSSKDLVYRKALPSTEKGTGNVLPSLKQLKFVTTETLHLSNKCFKNFTKEKSEQLPLYGQTLIIAFRHEEDLVFFSTFLSLYNGILLGGLYKNKPQTKSYLTALCKKTQKKSEVYKACLNVLAVTSRNLQKTASAPAINLMRLLIHISKLENKI